LVGAWRAREKGRADGGGPARETVYFGVSHLPPIGRAPTQCEKLVVLLVNSNLRAHKSHFAPLFADNMKWNEEFTKREEITIREVCTKDFQERKELIEKQLPQAVSRQEMRVEIELQDPGSLALETKVKYLKTIIKFQIQEDEHAEKRHGQTSRTQDRRRP
jgi:hypothetical protein